MLEILILTTLFGFGLSLKSRMGFANPFAIYFFVWSVVFVGYGLSAETFMPVPQEFFLLIFSSIFFAFVILLFIYFGKTKTKPQIIDATLGVRGKWLTVAQVACICSIPFAYEQANILSNQTDIFTVLGYIYLRSSVTEDGLGFGAINYFSVLSYVISSIRLYKYSTTGKEKAFLLMSLISSIFYAYINTGRTGFLLLMLMLVMPLVIGGVIGKKGVFLSLLLLAAMFLIVTFMTAKGASSESSFSENVESLALNLRSYTIAPILAFFNLENSLQNFSLGANSFRFFLSILNSLGFLDSPPPSLVRDYAYVPDPTNVYTVYDVYFRDFSYLGMFVPPAFLIFHWLLYKKSFGLGGKWIFYYSASIYPLCMQFFSDQYFSLLSIWLQVAFWCWLFIPKSSFAIDVAHSRRIRFRKYD